ncbi:hypothetical protein ABZP36_026109 [Zizania latifolia]
MLPPPAGHARRAVEEDEKASERVTSSAERCRPADGGGVRHGPGCPVRERDRDLRSTSTQLAGVLRADVRPIYRNS